MRQSDGSEILGPDDPRNLVIGIIHVSPSDDRQSVVNAITSQDQQGRDQIVLVLPAQNQSFKSAVDFAGLRQMAGELEAALVLVAPTRSKIANLARKESFTVYSSLEELTAEEFPPLESESAPAAEDEMEHAMMFPLELPNAPISPPASAEREADVAPGTSSVEEPEQEEPTAPSLVMPVEHTGEEEPTSPSIPAVSASSVAVPPSVEEDEEEPTSPSIPAVSANAAVPPPVEEDEEPTSPSLAVPPSADPQTADGQGNAATPSDYLPAVMPSNTGAVISSPPQLPTYYEPLEPPRQRSWRGLIIAGITVVVLLGLGILLYRPVLDLIFPPTASVTIVPNSQHLQRTYQITAVPGVPDLTKNQVDARALYADSQTQTRTVKATGQGHLAGQQAHGALIFYNTSASVQTIAAGTVVFDANGLAVVSEQTVSLPAFNTAVGPIGKAISAHTVGTGSAQNIPANDFNSTPCCAGGTVYVTNPQPFTGGQDQQTFTYVQQSDIDGVVQSMNTVLAQQASMALQGQVRTNERPVGSPRCAPQVRSDHQAGERADAVTVSVTTSCVGEVYDMQAVQVLAARNLTQDAASNPGPAYVPVGSISVQVTQATPDPRGNVLLVTSAAGIWAYQFTNAQRAHFANLIAGKSQQDARSILLGQTGVQDVTITLTGVGVTTVPSGTRRITITVEAVQGLRS